MSIFSIPIDRTRNATTKIASVVPGISIFLLNPNLLLRPSNFKSPASIAKVQYIAVLKSWTDGNRTKKADPNPQSWWNVYKYVLKWQNLLKHCKLANPYIILIPGMRNSSQFEQHITIIIEYFVHVKTRRTNGLKLRIVASWSKRFELENVLRGQKMLSRSYFSKQSQFGYTCLVFHIAEVGI